jgi:hypothetical protein
MAKPLSRGEVRAKAETARRDEDDVLLQIDRDGGQSMSGMAEHLGWFREGVPHKDRVRRATDKLKKDHLIDYKGRKWKVLPAGHDAITDIRAERFRAEQMAAGIAGMLSKQVVRDA